MNDDAAEGEQRPFDPRLAKGDNQRRWKCGRPDSNRYGSPRQRITATGMQNRRVYHFRHTRKRVSGPSSGGIPGRNRPLLGFILPLACLLADRPVPRIAGLADRRRRTMSIIDSWYCPQCGSHNIVGGIATECWQCSTPRPWHASRAALSLPGMNAGASRADW